MRLDAQTFFRRGVRALPAPLAGPDAREGVRGPQPLVPGIPPLPQHEAVRKVAPKSWYLH